ncbi:S8 family serine peptidase [Lysobacter gummosus]|uniref:S8 family serine peptidase n=1 Tax=Lysobacter gummosus TaxID=262324 RepID=A0ABY3XHU8_9GAMM|nr:S8 family serine peptidase [Lysobacter gummosus]ALN90763.1 subtilase family protein [Lysobacter gummosus]UNP31233.1 S8 family serine peptidase [Lysobacter gummosus]
MPNVVNRLTIAVSLVGLAALAGAAVRGLSNDSPADAGTIGGAPPPQRADSSLETQTSRYIVLFKEAPLSTYHGEVAGLPAPQRLAGAQNANSAAAAKSAGGGAGGRVDVRSAQARSYVQHLDQVQRDHESGIRALIGRPLNIERRMHHAVNGVITRMSQNEAARIAKLPGVELVEEYREYPLATDVGPQLIGAPALWNSTPANFRGEGVIVGVLDTGINFGSPAFAAIDDSGYHHINPNGSGNYLGTCAPGGVDEGRCNDKLIGGYDFVCGPPGNTCGVPGLREEPGFGDTNGHGSHTASTAAGNAWTANFKGRDVRISGVAPHANVIAYDVCYTIAATNQGQCPNTSAVAAVDQAIADGVDVINYSIGGGASPWGESVSLAFLNASDAGIYIAAAAGNSGPGASTMGHQEPWTSTTAASQHGRGTFAYLLQVTGPGAVPPALQAVQLTEGVSGTPFAASLPPTTPLRVSAGIDTAADGCAAFPANAFQNAIAVIRRGTCNFTDKVNNARNAGAIGVVIANNQAVVVSPSVPGTTIPTFMAAQTDADAIRDFSAGNANTSTAGIGFPPTPIPNTPDVLAAFSSRGPTNGLDLIKPDVTAPGVNVLAVLSGTTVSGSENLVGLLSGTSMASPHQAGAAALLRQARPSWTSAEIKSALMMTATPKVFKEDEVTPADAFAMGSGRIQVDQAVHAGLVLNETTANFLAADPSTGGDVSALNLASLDKRECVNSCTFERTFRHAGNGLQLYLVQVKGVQGIAFPPLLLSGPGQTSKLKVIVLSSSYAKDGAWHFGQVELKPLIGRDSPQLHLPIAIAVPPPQIVLTPEQVALSLPAGSRGFADFSIGNRSASALEFQIDNTGTASRTVTHSTAEGVNSGFRSTLYTDPATVGLPAQFSADDFVLTDSTRLAKLFSEGFVSSGSSLASTATSLSWSVYSDNAGNPSSNPLAGAAVWSYTAAPNAAGVKIDGANITLDLAAAGQNVQLPPGRYWLVVHARTSFANRWVWFASNAGDSQFRTIAPNASGAGSWIAGAGFAGLAFDIQGESACGAPWIGAPTRAFGVVPAQGSVANRVRIDTRGLAEGAHIGYVCVASDDPVRPKVALRVALTVTPR